MEIKGEENKNPIISFDVRSVPWNRGTTLGNPQPGDTGNLAPDAPFSSKVPGVVTAKAEELFALARKNSLWPMTFGIGLLRH